MDFISFSDLLSLLRLGKCVFQQIKTITLDLNQMEDKYLYFQMRYIFVRHYQEMTLRKIVGLIT